MENFKVDELNWKKKIESFNSLFHKEYNSGWENAYSVIVDVIELNPNDVEAFVRCLFLIHHVLLEETIPEALQIKFEMLLVKFYDESANKFSKNAEYLFFVGEIIITIEWFLKKEKDSSNLEENLSILMQKKASELEPDNILYEWAWRLSLNEKIAGYLASQILTYDKEHIDWLKSKGFPGEYILQSLEYSKKDFEGEIKS